MFSTKVEAHDCPHNGCQGRFKFLWKALVKAKQNEASEKEQRRKEEWEVIANFEGDALDEPFSTAGEQKVSRFLFAWISFTLAPESGWRPA